MPLERGAAIIIGFAMICVSIYYYFSKKPVTIYNNSNPPGVDQITNIRSYNHATARLMLVYCSFDSHARYSSGNGNIWKFYFKKVSKIMIIRIESISFILVNIKKVNKW